MNCLGTNRLTVLTGYGPYLARLELHSPCNMVIMFTLAADALALIIDEQLSLISLIVLCPEIDLLTGEPVPVREEMKHRLISPLALIHIIRVLRETCQIDKSEVTATGRETIRCGLANVIETCPDELATYKGIMFDHIP